MQWNIILALIFAIVIALFAIVNMDPVAINYLFGKAEVPLILIILGFTLAGAIIIVIINLARQYAKHKEIKSLKEELEKTKTELVNYQKYSDLVEKPVNQAEEEKVFIEQLVENQEETPIEEKLANNTKNPLEVGQEE